MLPQDQNFSLKLQVIEVELQIAKAQDAYERIFSDHIQKNFKTAKTFPKYVTHAVENTRVTVLAMLSQTLGLSNFNA
jgi:hypothetical protein